MSAITLKPITKVLNATLYLPGSKSIANRVLLLAAIARGISIIHNVPDVANDVIIMLDALKQLGVKINKLNNKTGVGSSYSIVGCDGKFPNLSATIFCGNSGTSMRFLLSVLALTKGSYELTGIQRMMERPINDLVIALSSMGANISYSTNVGYPPLCTKPFVDSLSCITQLSGRVSSQYLTGMLLALPLLNREVCIDIYDELISRPYVEITINLLHMFGCDISVDKNKYIIPANSKLHGVEYTIEPDASSASYFLALGAIAGDITVGNLSKDSLQGDKNFAQVLALLGANVTYNSFSINVKKANLNGITINMESMPDVAMTLAVMGLFAIGTTKITGIASWRVKETNRLQAMYKELSKFGGTVSITEDSITVIAPSKIKEDVIVDTYNDHRMAMCFSLLASYGITVTINDYRCVGKTFANYFEIFKQICY